MSEINLITNSLVDFANARCGEIPVLGTFTTTLSKSLKSQDAILKIWKSFVKSMGTTVRYRNVHFPLVAWAVESSKDSLHVHAVFDGFVHQIMLETAWRHTSDRSGQTYFNNFDTWHNIFIYIFKRFAKISKFFGLSVSLPPVNLSSMK